MKNKQTIIGSAQSLLLLALAAMLAACSGGSGGGGSDRENDLSGDLSEPEFVYSGPSPSSSKIQNFKINFYDQLVKNNRCGSCHTPGGGAPTHFVNQDDVNLAWQAANTVVNLADPAKSKVVQRVANGHNCWIPGGDATCAVTIQAYIERWAAGLAEGVTSVTLLPRTYYAPAPSQRLPDTYADAAALLPLSDSAELMGLLRSYCAGCHSDTSAQAQSPFFASADNDIAYDALSGRINLSSPSESRIVVRVAQERHNCGSNCGTIATEFTDAISRLAALVPAVGINLATTQISAAQGLVRDGIVASTGGRVEGSLLAKWEFREGEGITVADTSGVDPAIVLTASGDHTWMSGWGMRFDGGRAQGAVETSTKLSGQLSLTGEYTIETWVVPFNVSQEDAWIVAYSGSNTSRNFMLSQSLYNYNLAVRSSVGSGNGGEPILSTLGAQEAAQAALQHVVTTYTPLEGRKLYVNGVDMGLTDPVGGGQLNNWNAGFALTIGNSVGGNRPWQGAVRMAAVHDRALTQAQIAANYAVGVGQKYYMLFSIAEHINDPGNCNVGSGASRVDYCYIVFEVSEYDNASYLFARPVFINLNPSPSALSFNLQGLRLGINGQLALVGQSFSNLNVTVDSSTFSDVGFSQPAQVLSEQGTIIAKEFGPNGPDPDVFFLAFENINGNTSVFDDGSDDAASYAFTATGIDDVSDIIVRTFDQINQSFASITGVSSASAAVSAVTGKTVSETFTALKEQLPSVNSFQAYMSSHQMAVTQLAAAYCDALVQDAGLRASLFPGFDFSGNVSTHPQMSDETIIGETYWGGNIVDPLIDKSMNTGLLSAGARTGIYDRVVTLITDINDNHPYVFDGSNYVPDPDMSKHNKKDGLRYCLNNAPCPDAKTAEVVKGACTAVLASGALTIH
ncbi:LamG domain-containing protein [Dasania sp. GY-MA-18]|uniref:LamG domain-containing protein n=1 Tax=Dasania phycosphaerae TaxID=2950436 RepID=A0A9J6RKC4_9GAMM|nr:MULTISPECIES: LamG domain-containing protein [Dasania]MCR8922373.1 LamG domain-containing protein [Dasania sp. GY-MA-18]MCZ0864801.1 LamG domain-containing protein [Dasania phycosphaerae]MCZ0868529.1 LamG domain-containing protein [Dasania phycosphaerae]